MQDFAAPGRLVSSFIYMYNITTLCKTCDSIYRCTPVLLISVADVTQLAMAVSVTDV
jgi:hypothetical protein